MSSMNELFNMQVPPPKVRRLMNDFVIRLWLRLCPKVLQVCGESHEFFFGRVKVQFGVLQILMSAFGSSKWVNTCV